VKNPARVFLFMLTALVLYTGLQVGCLLPNASPHAVWVATVVFFWLILGWQFFYRSGSAPIESPWFLGVAWASLILLGVWATFIVIAIPIDLGSLVGLWAGFDRPWLAFQGILAIATVAAGISLLGFRQVLSGPIVKEVSIPIAGLSKNIEGLRIVQISDLHIGPTIRQGYVARVVRKVMELKPDLIAVTGDLVDGSVARLLEHLKPLADLKAPLGTFYVTGNHEYYWNAEEWVAKTRDLGFTPLIDENRVVTHNGAKILVGGVADSAASHFVPAHRSDAQRAAASEEKTDFKLLLSHRPGGYVQAEPAGFDLMLAGHTHGGQHFPFSFLIRFIHRYYRGLNRHGRLWIYVNPGTGYWGPPNRFGVPAEITLLKLTGEPSDHDNSKI